MLIIVSLALIIVLCNSNEPTDTTNNPTTSNKPTQDVPKGSIGLEYEFNEEENTYTVVGIGDCKDVIISIPSKHEEKSVTRIGTYAFENCNSITEVIFPSSIIEIKDYAFKGCDSLTKISLNNGLQTIGKGSFYECLKLPNIIVPNTVVYIGESSFYRCLNLDEISLSNEMLTISKNTFNGCVKLKKLQLPEKVEIIEERAFYNCTSIESVLIPNMVHTISEESFALNSSLKSVSLGKSVKHIAYNAFWNDDELSSIIVSEENLYYSDDGNNLYNKDKSVLFKYVKPKQTTISLPSTVTTINDYAFSGYDYLTDITISDSVTYIGECAFYGCGNLSNVVLGIKVNYIGKKVFYGCGNLQAVTFANTSNWEKSIDKASAYVIDVTSPTQNAILFLSDFRDYILFIPQEPTLDQKCASGQHLFSKTKLCENCKSNVEDLAVVSYDLSLNADKAVMGYIVDVEDKGYYLYVIGSGETKNFGFRATPFHEDDYNDEVIKVFISDQVTTIADYLFFEFTSLTEIDIPSTVTYIGQSAFCYCYALNEVSLSNNITYIGEKAFCQTRISSIRLPQELIYLGAQAFSHCQNLSQVEIFDKVLTIGIDVFKETSYYSNNSNWTNGVLYLGDCIIAAKTSVTSVIIDNNIKAIAAGAFKNCSNLQTIVFTNNNSIQNIGESTFMNCSSLDSIELPESIISIGDYAFYGCSSLPYGSIPETVGMP